MTTTAQTGTAIERLGSGQMFDRIARRYDLVNRVLSLGVDQSWRRRTVAAMNLAPGKQALDLATGTADLAIRIAQQTGANVVGSDPSQGMLAFGWPKVRKMGLVGQVALEEGDAQSLPYEDNSFDAVSIAFGIRNVPDRAKALREMARVTRRGGRVCILELSEPRSGILGPLARFHIRTLVPRIGALLSGSREYRYLQESIAAFPSPEDFAQLMEQSGLRIVSLEKLTFGVCCLYVAEPMPEAHEGAQAK